MLNKRGMSDEKTANAVDVEQRKRKGTRKIFLFAIIVILILFGVSYVPSSTTYAILNFADQYNSFRSLGTFYDSGKGKYFGKDYDVFLAGTSKGRFPNALDACRLFFPTAQVVRASEVPGPTFTFTDASGEKITKKGYANECYG